MALDEIALRAAGLPASLISLLVSITKAADRAMAAANTAAAANDLGGQIEAAIQVLSDLGAVPGLDNRMAELAVRLEAVEGITEVENVFMRGNVLILQRSDGTEIIGPEIILQGAPVDTPTITTGIPDQTLTVGQQELAIDLREIIDGADSYVISPAITQAYVDDYTLRINPHAILAGTTVSIRGRNAGGYSAPVSFALKINAPLPVVASAIPDQNMTVGQDATRIPLPPRFPGAASFAVEPEGMGAAIDGDDLVLIATAPRDATITVTAFNSTGQAVSDIFQLVVIVAQQAPAVQTPPTISGSTTVGSILTRTAGTATGIPAPTRATQWLRNGTILDGQTANTLDTTGFAVDDIITTRDVWTNTINGVVQEATGTSAPWTLTEQPKITAVITTPLVAGQQASITFNAAPDAQPTITQGQTIITATRVGTTNEWIFVPVAEGPISFSANKAGHTALNETRTVQPAAPDIAAVPADNTAEIRNLTASSPADALIIAAPSKYAGRHAFNPAELATGPMRIVAPTITGTGEVGTDLVLDLGIHAGASSWEGAPYINGVAQTGINGTSYRVQEADRGKNFDWRGNFYDVQGGKTPFQTTAIAIPAGGLDAGISQIGLFSAVSVDTGPRTIPIDIGVADPQKRVIVYYINQNAYTPKIVAGGVDYPVTVHHTRTLPNDRALVLASGEVPVGGAADLVISAGSATTNYAYVMVGKNLNYVHGHNVNSWGASGPRVANINLQSPTAVGDYLTLGILHQAATSGPIFTNPIMVTEHYDADLTANDRHLFIGTGIETTATANRQLGATIDRGGDNSMVAGVFRSK